MAAKGQTNWEVVSMVGTQNGVMVCLGQVYSGTVQPEYYEYSPMIGQL